MSISEKASTIASNNATIKSNVKKVYDAGYEDGIAAGGGSNEAEVLKYAYNMGGLFKDAVFPEGYELSANIPRCYKDLNELFRSAVGIKKITLTGLPGDTVYNTSYFVYQTADNLSSVEEIVLPDGIKLGAINNFALRASKLKTISGALDLSESTATTSCFQGCPELEEIRFVPGTIKLGLTFNKSSKLSNESIDSIINGLANMSGQTTLTLTLDSTVVNKLTPDQLTTMLNKNWNTG